MNPEWQKSCQVTNWGTKRILGRRNVARGPFSMHTVGFIRIWRLKMLCDFWACFDAPSWCAIWLHCCYKLPFTQAFFWPIQKNSSLKKLKDSKKNSNKFPKNSRISQLWRQNTTLLLDNSLEKMRVQLFFGFFLDWIQLSIHKLLIWYCFWV